MKQAKMQPLVSVLLPVYNQEDCLRDAIGSILNQTYTNWELLLINNGSTDTSILISKSYHKRFAPFIKVFSFKKHHTQEVVTNFARRYAKGKFLAHMSADTIAHPKRLEKQVAYLLSHPDTFSVGSWATTISNKNMILGIQESPIPSSCMFNTALNSGVVAQIPEPLIATRAYKTIASNIVTSGSFSIKQIGNPLSFLKKLAYKYITLPSVAITFAHEA